MVPDMLSPAEDVLSLGVPVMKDLFRSRRGTAQALPATGRIDACLAHVPLTCYATTAKAADTQDSPNGRNKSARAYRRHCHPARRCGGAHQGRRQKTAGVLGDDLALNAQQVTGVTADRELPVVWAVAKGSLPQQGHPRSGSAGDQRIRALGGDTPDDGRRLSVLRGLRETRPQVPIATSKTRPTTKSSSERSPTPGSTGCLRGRQDQGAIRTDFILSAGSSPLPSAPWPTPLHHNSRCWSASPS